ncbi:hypothetical protein Taro_006181 [Colocasia esculenta]|uniref:adenylate dimethylallyltransferase (ADP/ATP-dependent) n=1 Tax=Colocasia esculenta TaxID=4460 RepID=A0A843TZW1_COLES|nr:hypothetical protein [Colocasia esculenta]
MAVSKSAAAPFTMTMQLHTNTVANLLLAGSCPSMDAFNIHGTATIRKKKPVVVFVMGATGTGKSKLAIDLAARYPAEVINSDKIQIHRGLDVVTNKVTDEERAGVPHHLLGVADPDADFTATDFRRYATRAVESILERGRLPIVAGGSNSFIEALVDGNDGEFRRRYDCCFLCVDVELTELDSFVSRRVDNMVEAGLVEEVRGAFRQDGDYSKGIKRAIGVPEMDRYFRVEATTDKATRAKLLAMALEEIKANTRELARRQREKIRRLQQSGWVLHLLNATEAFLKRGTESVEAWEGLVAEPAVGIVRSFLYRSEVDEGNKTELGCRADDGRCGGGIVATEVGCNWGNACSCNCAANAKLVSAAPTALAATVPVAGATC